MEFKKVKGGDEYKKTIKMNHKLKMKHYLIIKLNHNMYKILKNNHKKHCNLNVVKNLNFHPMIQIHKYVKPTLMHNKMRSSKFLRKKVQENKIILVLHS